MAEPRRAVPRIFARKGVRSGPRLARRRAQDDDGLGANGSAFVYFGCVPVDSESPEAKILIPYVCGVLDALGVKNGPS
jgi:hypothetical protein